MKHMMLKRALAFLLTACILISDSAQAINALFQYAQQAEQILTQTRSLAVFDENPYPFTADFAALSGGEEEIIREETTDSASYGLQLAEIVPLSDILDAWAIPHGEGVLTASDVVKAEGEALLVEQNEDGWKISLPAAQSAILKLTLTDESTVNIPVKAPLTITANGDSQIYNGAPLTQEGFTSVGLAAEDHIESVTVTGSQTVAGTSDNVPSMAKIVNADGADVTSHYKIAYVNGTLEVTKKPLTITADSATKIYDSSPLSIDTYTHTELAKDDKIVDIVITGSQTYIGVSDNAPSAAVIKNAANEDVTDSYDIAYVNGSLTVTWPDGMIQKELTAFNGDLATYQITVNPNQIGLSENGEPLTLRDTFSENQSIDYASIEASDGITYDFSGYTGTYVIPDNYKATISYTTRVKGEVGKQVTFDNTAELGQMAGEDFIRGASVKVEETRTISPTGSDISGTGGVYGISLFAYPEGHMERGLEGAVFRMLDSNMRPMYYMSGEQVGQPITFTTDTDGRVDITLNEETDGLSIRKNTVYFLEMITAPYEDNDGKYVYYQKDNTFYSFLITDEPSYVYGNIYSYFNGDTLKVRCYPEAKGVNITKRFSGNYTLTDEQKNAIRFVLQKEAPGAGWVDVESHTYEEFSYGSINFNAGREGGTELEDLATYRVIEQNALPEELKNTIDEETFVTVSYQRDGVPVSEDSNEFFVDPDDKRAFSYDFAFTNEYVDHKLTVIKIDENTGKALPGAVFTAYAANVPETPVATYDADNGGSITIRKSDEEANYATGTLYYVVETEAPEGYSLPANPEKIYFYFSEIDDEVPDGLPVGASATDLTTSYNTVTLPNASDKVHISVTATWGVNGDEPWPENVSRVVVGLYKSVDGAAAEPVLADDQPRTLELTKAQYYDTATFSNLPAQENGKNIVYSVREEGVYNNADENITSQFAYSASISGSGWYVVNNQPAISVKVRKEWRDINGNVDTSANMPDVTFDLYRTTTPSDADALSFTRTEINELLKGAERVRSGLTLSKDGWSVTVESLRKADKQGNPYYYFALEDAPDNYEDTYTVTAATATEPRTLTIANKRTPTTVEIKANDLEKTYGDADPVYTFTASVKEEGATVAVSDPDDSGNYAVAVTAPNGTVRNVSFQVSRDAGENVGDYAVNLEGEVLQAGYRMLFEPGTLTIRQAEVTVTAGAEKVYGQPEPSLVTVVGLKNNEEASALHYTVSREEGEDVGEYPITLTGPTEQGNYKVTYVRADAEGNRHMFKITPAQATVTARNAEKLYGEDDPVFTATVDGLQFTDEASVIVYDLTREPGEAIGAYTITPVGDKAQGNYEVTYVPATFTIASASLTIKVRDAEKTYGDEDPEWEVDIEGLQGAESGATPSSELDSGTGARTYTYSIEKGEESVPLFSFTVSRQKGENVGDYLLTAAPTADSEQTQGNYTLTFDEPGALSILPAELTVTPDHVVKAIGRSDDPLLTATVTGWRNGDEECVKESVVGEGENAGIITWTYKRGDATLLKFTLQRDSGEEEGDYLITALGDEEQSNYRVEYEPGVFGILSILDVDVTQPLTDYADADANPEYCYTATLDLSATGLTEYSRYGFTMDNGVPTLTFTLPEDNANLKTLKIPGNAKLTVTQENANDDYTTAMRLDGAPYANPDAPTLYAYTFDRVDTYHEIAFVHSRISFPVAARAAVNQTEKEAKELKGREGAVGIPDGPDGVRAITADFADEMHSKMGYTLSADKYYVYDHASLYAMDGTAIEGASNVTEIRYDRDGAKWQYRTSGDFEDAPENSQLILFYLPKFVCKIGEDKFYSLKNAVESADKTENKTAKIEMLIGEYSIRSSPDAVTIPAGYTITVTTAETGYEGTGAAVISRSMNYASGHLFTNSGNLIFDKIILDGKNVPAKDAMALNKGNEATLTVEADATLQNASGVNGGAIYVESGVVNVHGALSGNTAANGGAVYQAGGSFIVKENGRLSGNTAANGGAAYLNGGNFTVETGGSLSGNTATNGGALYVINKGNAEISGALSGNTAANGGAAYLNGGAFTVKTGGSLSKNSATENGGAAYLNGGNFTVETGGSLSENSATNGGGIYRVSGTLTLGGEVINNTASGNGGGIHSLGGTLNVNATVTGNSATKNGGAIYVSGATLHINGRSVRDNAADGNGGAVCALNTTTEITGATMESNTADGNGGAVYMEGGSVTIADTSTLKGNKAVNGGGIYTTSGAVTLTAGELKENEAKTNGGAIYAASASVKVEAEVSLSGNKAEQGDGGGVYAESGAVSVSGGTLTDNSATNGKGGAVYAGSGTVNYTGGAITRNSAVNGAAIFAGSGIVNISASITGNAATNGGAVGVGGADARLYFDGNANVAGNTMNGAESNVYLDVDSELVINAKQLKSDKKIGVYVPGDVASALVKKRGDVTGYFGAYTNTNNLSNVFKSDRFGDLKVRFENNRLYWVNVLQYDVYYLKNYDEQFPPTSNYTASPSKKVCSGKQYEPRTRESNIYDLVMAMKLYEAHNDDFTKNVGNNYASLAVYAYTFSDQAMGNNFANYLKEVKWDAEARKWKFIKQDGAEAPADTSKLVIFYSAPAYLTIVNNNDSNLELDISELSVLGKDAADGLYGFVTAKNGATVQTLNAIAADDLKLKAGDSVKLMFPGAQGQSFTLKGTLIGDGAGESTTVEYTFNGGARQTIYGTAVDLTDSLNANDTAAELVFGNALPICKIGDEPFPTLKAAMDYAKVQKDATDNNAYTIEMLADYLVPKDDVLNIPEGYDITFTTAARDAETLPFTGNGARATLSRDSGNTGSSVTATQSTLTINNLAFDGRSLTAGGKGGAVSTTNCAMVTITNCDFKGYRADNGGAIYVENQNAGSSLTVEDCTFTNCQTNASVDKAGGGAIWTTARELYVRRCAFDSCACLKGSAQAGSVFHNIQGGWSANSITVISDCTFSNSYAVGGSGGTVESDALDITIERCSFEGSYTNKSGGNGGAINVYANNAASTSVYCILRVIDCAFNNCSAKNGSAYGGVIRTTSHDLILRDCIFRNTQSVTGGAVAMTNSKAQKAEIYGCTFENCIVTSNGGNGGNGGAVSVPVPTVIVGTSEQGRQLYEAENGGENPGETENGAENPSGTENDGKYLDGTPKDGNNHFTDCSANRGGGIDNPTNDASVTMENVNFTRCAARTSNGGALYTQAKTLSITGDSNTFTDCSGQGSGGAAFQNRNVDGSVVTLENCVFTGCVANNNGNGGGMYANARTLTISGDNNGFADCTAANAGGGLYHDYAGSVTIENCAFDNCTAKASYGGGLYTPAHSLTITGERSAFANCTAQTDGGGLYHNQNTNNASTFSFTGGSFDNCTAQGNNGGAIRISAKAVTLTDCSVKNSSSKAQGGGVWLNSSTASFDGCTITGNSVSNSDSKGGGVYISGGTTVYQNSVTSGCQAANGGGWYQNNGTLYILSGSISGDAVYGGGLYMYDGNAKVYHYGGTVSGTATANGGGVYKNNGNYTLGDGSYNETAYTGASIGALITLSVTENDGDATEERITSSAVNGGGLYNAGGTFTMNDGGRIGGAANSKATTDDTETDGENPDGTETDAENPDGTETDEEGELVYTATATNGGGVYVAGDAFRFYGGVITNCQAENGGGVYYASSGNNNDFFFYGTSTADGDSTAKIQNCLATNGGGVYLQSNTLHLGENGQASLGVIENCKATVNGGGVYQAGGTFNHRNASAIIACTAGADGGGVYHADGTFNFIGGSIIRNTASGRGGGVYHAGGAFQMSNGGAVIGGSAENGNTANVGAGVFVADAKATFNDGTAKTLEISYNHAVTEGGGIAVSGSNAGLTFQNAVTVRHNTMGTNNIECNVYLNQDSNEVIQNNWLDPSSYIGVYASDEQDAAHGQPGMPFATYNDNNENNLNVYRNDRRPFLYGMKKGENNLVIWVNFVCKITDGNGNLLYKDDNGTPAVYSELENKSAAGAFTTLNVDDTPALYRKDSDGTYIQYEGDEYQVQMLVETYNLVSGRQITLNKTVTRKITLTTASAQEDECGFAYAGDSRFAAAIKRTANAGSMIVVGGNGELTLQNITLDGGGYKATQEGAILRLESSGKATLDNGAVLQNGATSNKYGGAVYIKDANSALVMNVGSVVKDCTAGTSNGGAVHVNNGTFEMNGGSISGCSAGNGGGVYLNNSGKFNMNGGSIVGNNATSQGGNNATSQGGGVALVNGNARATFSGYCVVTGNTLNGSTRCNVQLCQNTNAIINSNGLDGRSEIGVYTADGAIFNAHGKKTTPFGTLIVAEDKFYCFVNDRDPKLRGVKGPDKLIYWEGSPLLRVEKDVVSDLSADKDAEFTFTVQFTLTDELKQYFTSNQHNTYGDMEFDKNGKATVTLKAGESATASLPDDFFTLEVPYTVTEELTEAQQADYATNGDTGMEGRTVSGQIGENISNDPNTSTALSLASFTNTRVTGELKISKQVTSGLAQDLEEEFSFTLTLDDKTITKAFEIAKEDEDKTAESKADFLDFTNGVATFTLKNGQTLTIKELPTDLGYAVEEELGDGQRANVRTTVSKDGGGAVSGATQKGVIGENSETVGGKSVYVSNVVFYNNFLGIVCKITNRNRELLYIRESNGNLKEAIFTHLEDAFKQINDGNLRIKVGWGSSAATGALRIEMVVPSYVMEGPATLDAGKTVTLSTALTTDRDGFPYNKGTNDGNGNISTVSRAFTDGSMLMDMGTLTIDKIILDGASTAETPVTASANGGIIQVANTANTVKLTVNSAATLRNSATTGDGGAIYLTSGASLDMNGIIQNCSATNGGGVYADANFKGISINGVISGCNAVGDGKENAESGGDGEESAGSGENVGNEEENAGSGKNTGNGGAVYASAGGAVNLNAGASLTGNKAVTNGGAVYADANITLRGVIGGADEAEGNVAGADGGGVYMGENAMFTMYAGSAISGNRAANGGGLVVRAATQIAGGTFANNSASGKGGAIYTLENALVTIRNEPAFTANKAAQGGAVYSGGSLTMTGGSMTANAATEKAGAVYVADGKTFTMSGGSVTDGNKSPEGAISTGKNAVLAFSGNVVVSGNTDPDGKDRMNVFLGYDSNSIITTSGLGVSANIGVYVTDGEPESEDTPDAVSNPIYCAHGLSARNFGTYTGSNINSASARLNKFVNDRDTALTGRSGEKISESIRYFIMWNGKGLQFQVYKVEADNPDVPAGKDIRFTLTRNADDGESVAVWSGKSNADGLVTIPWGPQESEGGDVANFKPYSKYTLKETSANASTVLPAGEWRVTVGRDNSLAWETVPSTESRVNRIMEMKPAVTADDSSTPDADDSSGSDADGAPDSSDASKNIIYLGSTFNLYNDAKPTLTYVVKKAKAETKKPETVNFTTTETNHSYEIKESNPTWDSHVFKCWATMEAKPTGEDGGVLSDSELAEKGYFEYQKGEKILFYRGTDEEKNAQGVSKGDLTLYAQWYEVVCKITDRDGTLLYVNGSPAVYGTLEDGFDAYNTASGYTFTYKNGIRATARNIEMLVEAYELHEPLTVERGKTVILTTAPSADTNGYAYTGAPGTVCEIKRGSSCNGSMITNTSNLTLMNITLDGGNREVDCNGGIVNNARTSAVLAIRDGATLRHSIVKGNGGAINAIAGTTVELTGGVITGNRVSENGSGAGICLATGSTLKLSGNPRFSDNFGGAMPSEATNGLEAYPVARQDIYLSEAQESPASIVVNGNLSGEPGSIWIWAEREAHYKTTKPFATIDKGVSLVEDAYKIFRNAQPDDVTENETDSWLYGTTEGDTPGYVYWNGLGGSRKVILRKVQADDGGGYASLSGKSFTIYKGSSTEAYTPKGKAPLSGLPSGESGCFWIGELPYGWYIVEENAPHRFFYLVVAASGVYGTLQEGGYGTRAQAEQYATEKYDAVKAANA